MHHLAGAFPAQDDRQTNDRQTAAHWARNPRGSDKRPAILASAIVVGLLLSLTILPAAEAAPAKKPLRVTDANFQKLVKSSWAAHGSTYWMVPSKGCTAEGPCNGLPQSHLSNGGVNVCDPAKKLCHECVSFVKSLANSKAGTDSWKPGPRVVAGGVSQGTAIATFKNGHYKGHTAVFDAYWRDSSGSIVGFTVYDQNWNKADDPARIVRWHPIRMQSGVEDVLNASQYFVVLA